MNKRNCLRGFVVVLFFTCIVINVAAQSFRGQYAPALKNTYFGINIGYINYPFSAKQLRPGNTVGSVKVPHTAVRIVLAGHEFNKHLSAQITYMRPVEWVQYRNVNNTGKTITVWMNVAGLTALGKWPLSKKLNLSTEAGLALIMRRGFSDNNQVIVTDASYGTVQFGGMLQYRANKKWTIQAGTVYSPANNKELQPHTIFHSAGFTYTLRELSKERVEKVRAAGYHFPGRTIAVSYSTNVLDYGVNKFVSQGVIPIFWGGEVKVKSAVQFRYESTLFHSKKVFSLGWGMQAGYWKTNRDGAHFFTLSAYPLLRFHTIRSPKTDFYLEYSVAGPSFISKVMMDGLNTGEKFTFLDQMGMGIFTGKNKCINAGVRIAHFSNGNLFPHNDGVMVPLSFSLGYSF